MRRRHRRPRLQTSGRHPPCALALPPLALPLRAAPPSQPRSEALGTHSLLTLPLFALPSSRTRVSMRGCEVP